MADAFHKMLDPPEPEIQQLDAHEKVLSNLVLESPNNNLTSINQLPDDILCYIFKRHCRQKATLELPFRANTPQITLSHVCSTWRRTMLNTPSFWRSITVTLKYIKPGHHGAIIATARECLSRAQKTPCFLVVKFEMDDGASYIIRQENWYQSLVNDLISPFYFKEIRIPFSDDHLKEFLELPNDKLSCIETLELRCFDPPSSCRLTVHPSLTPHSNSHKLANLSSFCLHPNPYGCSEAMTVIFPHIPWHQLRHIQLGVGVPGRTCLDIIQKSRTSLETCILVISDDHSFAKMPSIMLEPIHCSRLHSLDITIMKEMVNDLRHLFESFLLGIRMPKLKALKLGRSEGVLPVAVTILNRMKDASQMQLEVFTISKTSDKLDVEALLAVFPLLRQFDLPSSTVLTDDTILKLGAGTVAPCLEHFTLRNPDIELGKLLQMTKERCRVGETGKKREHEATPFKSVTFYNWEAPNLPPMYHRVLTEFFMFGPDVEVELPDPDM